MITLKMCACPGCGHEFTPRNRLSLYCSLNCCQHVYLARHPERILALQRAYYQRFKAAHPKPPRKRGLRNREARQECIQEVQYGDYCAALLEQIT